MSQFLFHFFWVTVFINMLLIYCRDCDWPWPCCRFINCSTLLTTSGSPSKKIDLWMTFSRWDLALLQAAIKQWCHKKYWGKCFVEGWFALVSPMFPWRKFPHIRLYANWWFTVIFGLCRSYHHFKLGVCWICNYELTHSCSTWCKWHIFCQNLGFNQVCQYTLNTLWKTLVQIIMLSYF